MKNWLNFVCVNVSPCYETVTDPGGVAPMWRKSMYISAVGFVAICVGIMFAPNT